MIMDEGRKITLLSNEPCKDDTFEGHAHQRIADKVAGIIKADAGRHIIGIEGGWGAGKSNLISLVNIGLNGKDVYEKGFNHKESAYPFFVYDAWGHQADFQRRAILEELTSDLTNEKKILEEEKWKKKLEELLAKRRKTTTKEVPSLGVGLIVTIMLTILTPLVVFVSGLIPAEYWWAKVIVSILPYLFGAWYAVNERKKNLKKYGQECTWENIAKEFFLIYKDQIKENETYTTISEKEPSSAEFKKWMEEVDEDLAPQNKTLVIVFDNMDRLPAQKVESLWSSIHSFFSDKTYEHIKVLIPFDRAHVQSAFKGENGEYGNDFINKTFDVVFRVPPPIMSGWQQYMAEKWKEAFGEDAELSISVTQIYEALSKNHTPRKIIAFVNEVATIKMTLDDDIPNRYIALFVFGKEKLDKDPIGQLLNPDYMGDVKFEYEQDNDTIKYLSALYYQLPVDSAMDVVFTIEATEALNSGNAERLNNMMEHISLSTILSKAILNVNSIENATKALAGLDSFYGYDDFGDMPDWLHKIWGDLLDKCESTDEKWDEIKDYHTTLFAHTLDKGLAEKLTEGYLSIVDDKWNAELYVQTMKKLKANNDLISVELRKRKRKVTPKLFLELLKYTHGDYEKYGVTFDRKEVDEYLKGLELKDAIAIDVIPYIKLGEKEEFFEFDAKLRDWLGETNRTDIKELKGLFARLKEVDCRPVRFENHFEDARIYNSWTQVEGTGDKFKYDLLAMRIARGNSFQSNYRPSFRDIIEAPDEQDIKNLASVIEWYVDYGDLLVNSDTYKDYPIVAAVVKDLTENSYGSSKASIMECLEHFDQTLEDYGMDDKKLYKKLSRWEKWFDFKEKSVDKMPSGLLRLSLTEDNALTNALHKACDEFYTGLTQEQWKQHILAKDNTYRIWKIYHPKKYQDNFDALKQLLKEYAGAANTTGYSKELMREWLDICMEVKHPVKSLFNEVSGVLKRDANVTKEKLLFLGAWILEHTDEEKQKDFIEKLIPTDIIDKDVVDFVAEHIERLAMCDVPEEFKEKIKHLAETTLTGDEKIGLVCEKMGIDVEREYREEN